MISWLQGTVQEIYGTIVTLNVGGVGYEVNATRAALAGLEVGEQASFTVFTDVKEDSIRLYGFAERLEREVFLLLTSVKGLGARSASELVSSIDARELLRIIGAGASDRLQAFKGIGKKTAERIVLELRDKVSEAVAAQKFAVTVERSSSANDLENDVLAALEALGFSRKECEAALKRIDPERRVGQEPGELVRQALSLI